MFLSQPVDTSLLPTLDGVTNSEPLVMAHLCRLYRPVMEAKEEEECRIPPAWTDFRYYPCRTANGTVAPSWGN